MEQENRKEFNAGGLALDLLRGKWLLANPQSYLPLVHRLLSRDVRFDDARLEDISLDSGSDSGSSSDSGTVKTVAIIPLHGALTKYETCEFRGATYFAQKIAKFAEKDDIVAIVLDIDSGGGAGNAIAPLIEAIEYAKGKGKPVIAHCDLCASAALWVASYCDLIYMDNDMSEIGSIGGYTTLAIPPEIDPATGERIIQIYAKESPDKNKPYRKACEGDYTLIENDLSPLIKQFQDTVKANRPNLKADAPGLMTGAMFPCRDAIRIGLADAVKTLSQTIDAAFAMAEI